ncbi:MAG: hypothetical protein KIT18_11625 [Burkholderiales bacterium]|nr:hypothetical protein [Burkholderiales bacterium]
MDAATVRQALEVDSAWTREARQTWLALMETTVWGDLRSSRLGATARIRKRALEVGERLSSLTGDREWIPHSRERLKSALAAALHLKESLAGLERAAADIDVGADAAALSAQLNGFRRLVAALDTYEVRWAELLDAQYRDGAE